MLTAPALTPPTRRPPTANAAPATPPPLAEALEHLARCHACVLRSFGNAKRLRGPLADAIAYKAILAQLDDLCDSVRSLRQPV